MTRRVRGIFFLVFVLGFLVSAPLVVLYTIGYRFNVQTRTIVQTGAISVESVPKDARVFVDDKLLRDSTPVFDDNVLPGEHVVRIEKDGYTMWEKTLLIESRQTTFVEDALLYLDEPATRVDDTPFADISAHRPTGNALVRRTQGQWSEMWLHHSDQEEEMLLARVPGSAATTFHVVWEPTGRMVAIESTDSVRTNLLLTNTQTGESTSVNDLLPGVREWFWDAGGSGDFFAKTPAGLFRVRENVAELTSLTADAVMTRGEDLVIAQRVEDRAVISRERGENREILAHLPLATYTFVASPDDVVHLTDNQGRMVILDAKGGNQPILLNTEATAWRWHSEDARLLYTDGFGLHIYDAKEHTNETLTRLSQVITDIAWHPIAEGVFYTQDGNLFALELAIEDGRETQNLLNAEEISDLWLDEKGEVLYLVATIDGERALYERPLMR